MQSGGSGQEVWQTVRQQKQSQQYDRRHKGTWHYSVERCVRRRWQCLAFNEWHSQCDSHIVLHANRFAFAFTLKPNVTDFTVHRIPRLIRYKSTVIENHSIELSDKYSRYESICLIIQLVFWESMTGIPFNTQYSTHGWDAKKNACIACSQTSVALHCI